ncbi:MAG: NirD/YgiW/YdeI family stress tolerance protein [Thermosynechococcaceae cyanobacterium]
MITVGIALAAIAIPAFALTQNNRRDAAKRTTPAEDVMTVPVLAQTHTSIEDARSANSTTLSGKIIRISGDDFILDDGTGQVWIEAESRPLRRAKLAAGETVTVTGYLDENELEAYRITRANGERIDILDD